MTFYILAPKLLTKPFIFKSNLLTSISGVELRGTSTLMGSIPAKPLSLKMK